MLIMEHAMWYLISFFFFLFQLPVVLSCVTSFHIWNWKQLIPMILTIAVKEIELCCTVFVYIGDQYVVLFLQLELIDWESGMEIMQLMKAWSSIELREWRPCANRSVPEAGGFFSGWLIVQSSKFVLVGCCIFCIISFSLFCFFGVHLSLIQFIFNFTFTYGILIIYFIMCPCSLCWRNLLTLFLPSFLMLFFRLRIAKVKWVPYNRSKWWIESATLVGMPIDETKDFIFYWFIYLEFLYHVRYIGMVIPFHVMRDSLFLCGK